MYFNCNCKTKVFQMQTQVHFLSRQTIYSIITPINFDLTRMLLYIITHEMTKRCIMRHLRHCEVDHFPPNFKSHIFYEHTVFLKSYLRTSKQVSNMYLTFLFCFFRKWTNTWNLFV